MRAFIILILSCVSVLGADTGIRVVTTTKTNADTASIYTRDVFTRDGQTNLVRRSKTTTGVVQIRIYRFYHDGVHVGDYVTMRDSSGFTTEANCPYSVSFEFSRSKELASAVIGSKDGAILDAFSCTNGLLCPDEASRIQQANELGADIDVEHIRSTPTSEFIKEQEEWVKKYKQKSTLP